MRRNSYVPNKMWAGALGIWRVMSKKKNTKKGWSAPWLGSCTCKLSHVSCSWLYCIAITETCYFCAVNAPMFSAKKSTSTVIAPDLLVALKKKNWSTHLPMPVWLSEGVLYILITTVRTRRTLTCMRHSTGDRIPLTRRSHRKWFCVHNNKIIKIE